MGATDTLVNPSLSPADPSNSSRQDSHPSQGASTSQLSGSPVELLAAEPDSDDSTSLVVLRLPAELLVLPRLAVPLVPVVPDGFGSAETEGPQPKLTTRAHRSVRMLLL